MLSLVLPTYNESQNLEPLLQALAGVLQPGDEVLIVDDDSPDRTWEKAEAMRSAFPFLRVIRRVGRRGLSSAVIEGFEAAKGNVLAVMDADLQHDPAVLRALADGIERGAPLAVASRYMKGGGVGEWAANRRLLSSAGTTLAQFLLPVSVSDPMSGFFAMNRQTFQSMRDRLHPHGFKILLEIASFLPRGSSVFHAPLQFRPRLHGASKMSVSVLIAFGVQLLHLFLRRLSAYAWWIFWIACAVTALVLLPRAWAMRPLLESETRGNAQTALTALANRHGWILSDLQVRGFQGSEMEVLHRAHGRGPDDSTCVLVSLDTFVERTCK